MREQDADELWCAFRRERCTEALRALVERHVSAVWSAARRVTGGDAALAEEVTQTVFADFARKAGALPASTVVGAWLHRHTFFTASKAVRAEVRRRHRETQAATVISDHTSAGSPDETHALWAELAPHLDAALEALPRGERELIALRFFEDRSWREVALALGTTEDAARKRLARVLEKLRSRLGGRSSLARNVSVAALAALFSTRAIEAAPGGVTGAVSDAALAAGRAAGASVGGMSLVALVRRSLTRPGVVVGAGVTAVALVVWLIGPAAGWFAMDDASPAAGVTSHVLPAPHTRAPKIALEGQLTFFDVAGPAIEAALLKHRPFAGDPELFRQLTAMATGEGEREVIPVHLAYGGSGKTERGDPFEYPVTYDYAGDTGEPAGKAKEMRLIGISAEVEAEAVDPAGKIKCAFEVNHETLANRMDRWRLSVSGGMGGPFLELPRFLELKLHTQCTVTVGEPTLLGVTQVPWKGDDGDRPGGPRYALWFFEVQPSAAGRSLEPTSDERIAPDVLIEATAFGARSQGGEFGRWRMAGEDAELYRQLSSPGGAGEDVVLSHWAVRTISGGRGRVAAWDDASYPTNIEFNGGAQTIAPVGFETTAIGRLLEVEPVVGQMLSPDGGKVAAWLPEIDLMMTGEISGPRAWDLTRWVPRTMAAVPGEHPVSKVVTPLALVSGQRRLASVTTVGDEVGRLARERQTGPRVTFVRATADLPVPGPSVAENLCTELIALRVPRESGWRQLLDRSPGQDEAWLEQLLNLAESSMGGVSVVGEWTQVARSGNRARVEGGAQMLRVAGRDEDSLMPAELGELPWGADVWTEATLGPQGTDGVSLTATLSRTERPVEMRIDAGSGSSAPELYSFHRQLGTTLALRLGEVRLLAATAVPKGIRRLASGEADDDSLELVFVRCRNSDGVLGPATAEPPRAAESALFTLSVAGAEGQAIAAVLHDEALAAQATEELMERFSAGGATLVASAAVAGVGGVSSSVRATGECGAGWFPFATDQTRGLTNHEAKVVDDEGLLASFQWQRLGDGSPEEGAVLAAEWLVSATQQEIGELQPKTRAKTVLAQRFMPWDRLILLDAQPAPVPVGHAEHGRWHVVLGKVRGLR